MDASNDRRIVTDALAKADLSEYELGFVDAILYRMGVTTDDATGEQLASALHELSCFKGPA